MNEKEIKEELFRILYKVVEDITLTEWRFIHTYLTYEILEEFIDESGYAVEIEGFNTEEVYDINISDIYKDIFNLDLEN
jgi:hypothetical protein